MQQDMIVILDLGSHENTMVARAVRELGVYSEIKPHDITAAELKELPNVKGIIINGGENNIIDGQPIDVEAAVYQFGVPVMSVGHTLAKVEICLPGRNIQLCWKCSKNLFLMSVMPQPTGI